MHEDLSRREKIKVSSDRSFGLVIGGLLVLVGVAPLLRAPHDHLRWWALAPGAVLVALALVWQAPLAPLNRLWARLGLLLYRVTNPVILGVLYYLVVTPIGLLMRACGNDPLALRRDAAAASYWRIRTPPGPSPESMKQQF